jgi:enoyl-CoA hydratase
VICYDVRGAFATATLDSPDTRNALDDAMLAGLADAVAQAREPKVRALVLDHTGGTFCAGASLGSDIGSGTARFAALLRSLLELDKPVVVRIDGHVRAGGVGLVAACDIAIAGPAATFAVPEARLGLAPVIIAPLLAPVLGRRAASRLMLTGVAVDAAEAARIGLVTVAVDDTAAAVAELLEQLGAASPQGLAETKRLSTRELLAIWDAEAEERATKSAALFGSEEAQQGIAAFRSRREPPWRVHA